VVGGTDYTPTATALAGTVAITVDSSSSAVCAISGGLVSFSGVGTCKVDYTSGAADGYTASSTSETFTVYAASGANTITITSTKPTDAVVGGTGYTPTATALAGTVAITVDSSSSAVCAISGGVVSFSGVGSCKVDYTSGAADGYTASSTSETFTVAALANQAALTLTSTSGTYGTPLTLTTSGGSGTGAVSYAVTAAGSAGCSLTGGGTTLSATSAGTCTVTATKAADANYNAVSSTATTVTFATPVPSPPPPSSSPSPPSPPPSPSGATSSQNCSSSSSSGTCNTTNDQTTVSGSGEGAVTVSQYPSDPVSSPSFSTSGEYFDVQVASGSSFSSLTITDCNLNGGTSLEWWNGGAWEPVTPTSYTAGPPACVSAAISSTSSPGLSQLTGTVFAAAALATVPGAPTKVSATAGNASATLTWTAPSSDGGAAVTGYVIKVSHGPVVKVADVTSDTVTGLNNGTVYSFTVAAINTIGTGPSSAASNSVTPANATSVTVLKLSLKKVTYGDEQTEHISVSVSPQHSGSTPTGTVTIKASATTLCVIKLKSAKGSCSLSSKELKPGTYHLVATYGGSLEFVGSFASETLTVVTLTVVTGTLTVVPSTVVRGGTVTVTGKGFSAGAAVSINVCNIKKVTTAAFNEAFPGHINVSFKMPDSAPLGACKFTATGLGTGNQTLALTTTVIVKSATKTALKLSAAKVTYGDEQVEQMSVTLSPEFTAPAPTEKVTISDGKTTLCVLAPFSGKGSCGLTAKELKSAGTYHLVATHGGSLEFVGSFARETLTVVK